MDLNVHKPLYYVFASSLRYSKKSEYTSPSNLLAFEPSSPNCGLNKAVDRLKVKV
jgi:hypothetical protein